MSREHLLEATSASARALDLAPTDTVCGHLRNALTILQLGDAEFARPMGVPLPTEGIRRFDLATLADIETRIRAALVLVEQSATAFGLAYVPEVTPRYELTDAGRSALGDDDADDDDADDDDVCPACGEPFDVIRRGDERRICLECGEREPAREGR